MTVFLLVMLCMAVFAVGLIVWVAFNGQPVSRPIIDRAVRHQGQGHPLRYSVMGDSTTVSQGGDYAQGYAVMTAQSLAERYSVAWQNVGVSGARCSDVALAQLPQALDFKPDVVLIAVGANDVTHYTSIAVCVRHMETIFQALQQQNPAVKIIITGAPAMGTVPRFPGVVRWLAAWRTAQLNAALMAVAKKYNGVFAPIAERTAALYRQHPELFAADKFHPTTEGYKPWLPVLLEAFKRAGL